MEEKIVTYGVNKLIQSVSTNTRFLGEIEWVK